MSWRRWGTAVMARAASCRSTGGWCARQRPADLGAGPSGNTADPSTVPGVIDTVKERFGIERVILSATGDDHRRARRHAQRARRRVRVGAEDRPDPQADRRRRSAAVTVRSGQPRRDLSEEFPSERLVVCRNPHLAAERARKREDLLASTERELAKVCQMSQGRAARCATPTPGRSASAPRVINKYKVAKHFDLQIADARSATSANRADQRRGRARRALRAQPPAPPSSSPPKRSCASTSS